MINLAIRLSLCKTRHHLLVAVLPIRALSYFSTKRVCCTFTNYFVHATFLTSILEFIIYSQEGNDFTKYIPTACCSSLMCQALGCPWELRIHEERVSLPSQSLRAGEAVLRKAGCDSTVWRVTWAEKTDLTGIKTWKAQQQHRRLGHPKTDLLRC